ncbi:MAG: helix-turn-helix transcriptional regulator, partial [Oscillospiraceae bacterium]|nr:helix-turn-helix transcriptional regulator [Oscillospiraceae bacterium]
MEFSEKLQTLRKKKGLTQEELAQALFVSRTAISKWESGKGYP